MTVWVLMVMLAGIAGAFYAGFRMGKPASAKPRVPDSVLAQRAAALCAEAEELDAGGEYRRHVVYARLRKEFPGILKRIVSRAIEDNLPE